MMVKMIYPFTAEVEGEHHHGAVDFGPPGVHPPPVAEEPPEDVGLDPRHHGDAESRYKPRSSQARW